MHRPNGFPRGASGCIYASSLARGAVVPIVVQYVTPGALVRPLTPTECRVLRLVGGGLSNPDIGRALGSAPATVKCHIRAIAEKVAELGTSPRMPAKRLVFWYALVEARQNGPTVEAGPVRR